MAKQKHYINNEDFLKALVDYKTACKLAKKEKKPPPAIPNYIGECFMKIAEGLSHKPNFINYTYRDEMISDGIENCLTHFLIKKSDTPDAKKWNSYSYDFLFFVGNKNNLTFDEIENLVTIFNFDIEEVEQNKIREIVKEFMKVVGYSLQLNGKVIDVKSKLDLETIWKD